jgi:predicted NAD/FAD-dependent oxidoreductase
VLLFAGEGLGRTREVYAISDRSGHPLLWTACENHKAGRITPGNTALVVQASRGFSEQHLEGDPDVWSAELGELACERWDIPHDRLRKTSAHRWRLARVETPATTIELPPGWTYAGDGWGESRVESAWLAGWAAAEGLLQAG